MGNGIANCKFIYFTTITKLILIMLVCSNVCVGDHMTISHADTGYWTLVAAVRSQHVTTAPARQQTVEQILPWCPLQKHKRKGGWPDFRSLQSKVYAVARCKACRRQGPLIVIIILISINQVCRPSHRQSFKWPAIYYSYLYNILKVCEHYEKWMLCYKT